MFVGLAVMSNVKISYITLFQAEADHSDTAKILDISILPWYNIRKYIHHKITKVQSRCSREKKPIISFWAYAIQK